MTLKNKTPQEIWKMYDNCIQHNNNIELYDTVKENENFFIGKQWEGVIAPDLDHPVLNFIKRVVIFFIANIVSDDISASIEMFEETEDSKLINSIISSEIERLMELTKFKDNCRDMLRNCAVDGDGAFYFYFNPDIKTGQLVNGDIDIDNVRNTSILFLNSWEDDPQRQSGIIIPVRKLVDTIKKDAKDNDIPDEDIQSIKSDKDYNQVNSENDTADDSATELVVFWKDEGTVWCCKCTENVITKKPYDTEYTMYPIPYMSWDKIPNTYHGQSCVTGLIPNQIAVNKLYAMAIESVKKTAFPKIFFDNTKMKQFTNKVGQAIGVAGDPNSLIYTTTTKGAEFSSQVMTLIESIISYTKEFMGANDAALGNISNPKNTSAIIAASQGSTMPLSLQKKSFYRFVEDSIRIMICIMATDYGTRNVKFTDADGITKIVEFDFNKLKDINYKLNVDIGESSYWSEFTQLQTMDNLWQAGIVKDAVLYLESIPNGKIKNKQKIIASLKQMQGMAQQVPQQQTIPQDDTSNNANVDYEAMAQFVDSLPHEQQEQLKALPPQEMEQAVISMMNGGE